MAPLPLEKGAWRRVLQSICEPWLDPTMSGTREEALTLILGHRAGMEDTRGSGR